MHRRRKAPAFPARLPAAIGLLGLLAALCFAVGSASAARNSVLPPVEKPSFVVIQTDLAHDALPTNKDGSVDEEGKGIEPQDEIEDIPVGDTQNLTVNLAAGSYVLICNIYDKDEQESHYQEGMRVSFTVE